MACSSRFTELIALQEQSQFSARSAFTLSRPAAGCGELGLGHDAARTLRDDGCLVLYRAPHDSDAWRVVETVVAPVSWNPELEFHIAQKRR